MRKDKKTAHELRTLGKSYTEIHLQLGVPKSTLSGWFSNQKWSNDIAIKCAKNAVNSSIVRLVALNTIRGEHLKRLYEEALADAVEDYSKLRYHPLFIAGLMIYWGEGDKTSKYRVSIANTEPQMIKIFKLFLKNICGLENAKAWILLYPDLDEVTCKKYWMEKCGLKYDQFTKSMVIKGKTPLRKLSYGVCNMGISSAYLKNKILKWIELLAHDIGEEKYIAGIV